MPKSKPKQNACPFGKAGFKNKRDAEAASPRGKAKRCGRCRQWHPEP